MKKQWFETWFDSPYYHLLYKNRDNTEAAVFIDNLLDYLKPSQDCLFLDLACGKGRHSIYLHSKGFNVVGSDYSSNNITLAKQSETSGLKFVKHDMRDELPKNTYDCVVNLFTSFGYFRKDEEHLKTINNVWSSLKPGGRFVIDFLNINWVKDHLNNQEVKTIDGIDFHINKTFKEGFIRKSISFMFEGEQREFNEEVRGFTQDELVSLLTEGGFKIHSTFGNYVLEEFNSGSSDRLIIVAEKC